MATDKKQAAEMQKPQFIHDCDKCTFLGRYRSRMFSVVPKGSADPISNYDLYYCGCTVVARYGDKGSDYTSGFGTVGVLPLREARIRAERLGVDFGALRDDKIKKLVVEAHDRYRGFAPIFEGVLKLKELMVTAWSLNDEDFKKLAWVLEVDDDFSSEQAEMLLDVVQKLRAAGSD